MYNIHDLFHACEIGDIKRAEAFFEENNIDVDTPDNDDLTALQVAAANDQVIMIWLRKMNFPPRRGVVERVGEMAKTPTCRPHVAHTANLSPRNAYMLPTCRRHVDNPSDFYLWHSHKVYKLL